MILHTLCASPSSAAFTECMGLIGPADALLLLGDGIYALQTAASLDNCQAEIYALEEDARAAGIQQLPEGVSWASMVDFVSLSERFSKQLAWY